MRKYINLVLTNLAQGQQLANIMIWELAQYLHANPDDIYHPNEFAREMQIE